MLPVDKKALVRWLVQCDTSNMGGWSKVQAILFGPQNQGIGVWALDHDDAKRIIKRCTVPHLRYLLTTLAVEPMAGREPMLTLPLCAGYYKTPVQLLPTRKRTQADKWHQPRAPHLKVRLDLPPPE